MKIDFSSGKETVDAGAKRTPYTPPYKASEVNLQQVEPKSAYLPYGERHAAKYGVPVLANLQQAMESRAKGQFVLTLREADAAARNEIPLDNELLKQAMIVGPKCGVLGMIHEGIPGVQGNVYELRNQYNKGVQFYKTGKYNIAPEIQKKAADARMTSLRQGLEEAGLPLWPEEIKDGLATELCKPEYMTWHQYQEASSNKVFLFDPNAAVEFETEESSDVDAAS